jgi:hypothetical protein
VDKKDIAVEIRRTDLIYVRRAIDDAIAEVQAGVADGLIDESVLIALDESLNILEGYLK